MTTRESVSQVRSPARPARKARYICLMRATSCVIIRLLKTDGEALRFPPVSCLLGGSEVVKTKVFVTLKPSVFDPQGKTIVDALRSMGYTAVQDVRQGKYFELDVEAGSTDEARSMVAEVAEKLLANPVIESYRVEVDDERSQESGVRRQETA